MDILRDSLDKLSGFSAPKVAEIARREGYRVSPKVIINVRNGRTKSPKYGVVQALEAAARALEEGGAA